MNICIPNFFFQVSSQMFSSYRVSPDYPVWKSTLSIALSPYPLLLSSQTHPTLYYMYARIYLFLVLYQCLIHGHNMRTRTQTNEFTVSLAPWSETDPGSCAILIKWVIEFTCLFSSLTIHLFHFILRRKCISSLLSLGEVFYNLWLFIHWQAFDFERLWMYPLNFWTNTTFELQNLSGLWFLF